MQNKSMNLFEEVTSFPNLYTAAIEAAQGHKHNLRVQKFLFNLENEILVLQKNLRNGRYKPTGYFVFKIRDPKPRVIHAPPFHDQVVQHAICRVLEPRFESRLIKDTYACRLGKGTHAAVSRAQAFSRRTAYFLKCDIKTYFDSIDHAVLKALLRKIVHDEALLHVMTLIIDFQPTTTPVGKGLPLGNLTSQHFANLYLGELDHFVKDYLGCKFYVRYMDDFILWAQSKHALWDCYRWINVFLLNRLKLNFKDKATSLKPASQGVPFLGFRIFPNLIRIERKNLVRLRRKIKARQNEFVTGKINEEVLTQSVTSMLAHIAHANSLRLRQKELGDNSATQQRERWSCWL